jgi:glycosyltransferase involved in cell wall biosynthesis
MPALIWVNQFALLPGDGGGTRHFELGRELVNKGWRVSILASDFHLHARKYTRRARPTDHRTKCELQDGVELRWLWASAYEFNDWRRAMNWLTFYRSVIRELGSLGQPPDVVIGSSPQLFAASAARRLARKARVPFVFEVRDLWPESLVAAGGSRGPAYWFLDRVAAGLYRDADRVLVLARGTREYLVQRGVADSKIVHVPNGVDIDAIQPMAEPRGRDADLDAGPFTLIYAGAHGPANGLDRVLDAAEILGAAANVRFVLVGDGPSKPALRQDAARRGLAHVEFHDAVSKYELPALLNASDAGLMVLRESPLFSFGVSPNKLFDYLAAGLPVICNVPGELAQMVERAGAGVQVVSTSGSALADGIRALASLSVAQRQRMGRAGRGWVEREHSRQVLGQRLNAFLSELVGQ